MFGPDIARVKINTSTADFARKDFKDFGSGLRQSGQGFRKKVQNTADGTKIPGAMIPKYPDTVQTEISGFKK